MLVRQVSSKSFHTKLKFKVYHQIQKIRQKNQYLQPLLLPRYMKEFNIKRKQDAQQSQRDRAAGCAIVLAKS